MCEELIRTVNEDSCLSLISLKSFCSPAINNLKTRFIKVKRRTQFPLNYLTSIKLSPS